MDKHVEHDSDLRSYLIGFVASLALSGGAFFIALFAGWNRFAIMGGLAALAFCQLFVQLRYFLHIDGRRENREDLYLIIFSVSVLLMMVIGTIWVLGNLEQRMDMDMDMKM